MQAKTQHRVVRLPAGARGGGTWGCETWPAAFTRVQRTMGRGSSPPWRLRDAPQHCRMAAGVQRRALKTRTVHDTDPPHASLLALRCVPAAGIIAKGNNGCVGHAVGPHGGSGAVTGPSARERGEEEGLSGANLGGFGGAGGSGGGDMGMRDMAISVHTGAKDNGPRFQPAAATKRRPTTSTNGGGRAATGAKNTHCARHRPTPRLSPRALRCVPTAGMVTKGHCGCLGHAGGPRGCSGAVTAPAARGRGGEGGCRAVFGRVWGVPAGLGGRCSPIPARGAWLWVLGT